MIASVFANANKGNLQIADLARRDPEHVGNVFGLEQLGYSECHVVAAPNVNGCASSIARDVGP